MKSTLRTCIWGLMVVVVLVMGACTAKPTNPAIPGDQEKTSEPSTERMVGISFPTEASARWGDEGKALKNALHEMGYGVNLMFAGDKTKKQLEDIQQMLEDGVNILIISPVDDGEFQELLKIVHNNGVLVIAYDRMITQTKDIDFLVTYNHTETGLLQAKQIEQALGLPDATGPFHIEFFAGDADDNQAKEIYEASLSILKPYIDTGQLVIRSGQMDLDEIAISQWNDVTAQARMSKLLATYYKRERLDAILSPSDSISLGVISALKKAGYGTDKPFPVITGAGAEIDSVRAILAGEQTFTILLDERILVKQAAEIVDAVMQGKIVPVNNKLAYHNGEKIIPTYEIFPIGIERSNYKEVLVNSGYIAEDQLTQSSEK